MKTEIKVNAEMSTEDHIERCQDLEKEREIVNRCLSRHNANSVDLLKPLVTNAEEFSVNEDKEDVGKNHPN